jgi:hypothetical protein
MGVLDGVLGGVVGAEALSLVKGYLEKHGGVHGVVADFERNGLGQQVKSWVPTGPNSDHHRADPPSSGVVNLKDWPTNSVFPPIRFLNFWPSPRRSTN